MSTATNRPINRKIVLVDHVKGMVSPEYFRLEGAVGKGQRYDTGPENADCNSGQLRQAVIDPENEDENRNCANDFNIETVEASKRPLC